MKDIPEIKTYFVEYECGGRRRTKTVEAHQTETFHNYPLTLAFIKLTSKGEAYPTHETLVIISDIKCFEIKA